MPAPESLALGQQGDSGLFLPAGGVGGQHFLADPA